MEIAGYSPLVQVYMPNLAMARLAILESWRRCGTVDDMGGGTSCRYGDIHWNVIGGLEYYAVICQSLFGCNLPKSF